MGGVGVRPSELPAIMHGYFSAFPDADSEVTDWIESPTGVAVEQVITATHTGPWMTAFGQLAPTGRTVRWLPPNDPTQGRLAQKRGDIETARANETGGASWLPRTTRP